MAKDVNPKRTSPEPLKVIKPEPLKIIKPEPLKKVDETPIVVKVTPKPVVKEKSLWPALHPEANQNPTSRALMKERTEKILEHKRELEKAIKEEATKKVKAEKEL